MPGHQARTHGDSGVNASLTPEGGAAKVGKWWGGGTILSEYCEYRYCEYCELSQMVRDRPTAKRFYKTAIPVYIDRIKKTKVDGYCSDTNTM